MYLKPVATVPCEMHKCRIMQEMQIRQERCCQTLAQNLSVLDRFLNLFHHYKENI